MRLGAAIETCLLHMGLLEVPARSDDLWLIFAPVLPRRGLEVRDEGRVRPNRPMKLTGACGAPSLSA
jgi:hypothetical protein